MPSDVDDSHYEVNNEKVKANCGWITKEFLQEVIRGHEGNEDIRVIGSEVKAAVGLGDNYLSIIYQVTAELVNEKTGRKETRHFLIKGLPSAKILQTVVQECGFFRKELYFYSVCLTGMRSIMEEYMPDESDFIAAESYNCNLPDVVVLENLKVSGYRMAHRREQLDFEHTATTVRSLARLHALSVRLVKIKPEVTAELSANEIYSAEKRSTSHEYVAKALVSWTKIMGEQETTRHMLPLMEKATENLLEKIFYVVGKTEDSFLAINHGDSWTNNFMYKYDKDGNVSHAKIVDFQMARYSSPALDLLYFLFSSPKPDMLAEKFEDVIKIYHEALVSDMNKLRLDPVPTLEEIHRELRERSIFGVMSMLVTTPVALAKPSNYTDLGDIDASESREGYLLEKYFRDTLYQEVAVKYGAIMEKLGYLKSAEELVVPIQ